MHKKLNQVECFLLLFFFLSSSSPSPFFVGYLLLPKRAAAAAVVVRQVYQSFFPPSKRLNAFAHLPCSAAAAVVEPLIMISLKLLFFIEIIFMTNS